MDQFLEPEEDPDPNMNGTSTLSPDMEGSSSLSPDMDGSSSLRPDTSVPDSNTESGQNKNAAFAFFVGAVLLMRRCIN